jgi:hypothetical protein
LRSLVDRLDLSPEGRTPFRVLSLGLIQRRLRPVDGPLAAIEAEQPRPHRRTT